MHMMKHLKASTVLHLFIIISSGAITTKLSVKAESFDNFTVEATTEADGDDVGDEDVMKWAWYPIRWSWWVIAQVVCAVIGVIGNGIVAAVIFRRIEKKRAMDMLIGSLAIADLLTSIFLFPIPWAKSVPPGIMGTLYCKLLYPSYFLWLSITASTYILMAICIERYIAVVHPLYFKRVVTRSKASVAVLLVWVFSILQCVYSLVIFRYDDDKHGCKSTVDTMPERIGRAYYAFNVRLVVPVLTMVISQIAIAVSLQRQSKRSRELNADSPSPDSPSFHIVARNRVIKLMLVVVLVYVVTWTPNQVAYLCFNLGYITSSYRGSPLHRALTVLAFLNSCANPFIYTAGHKKFRQAVKELFSSESSPSAPVFDHDRAEGKQNKSNFKF